MWLVMKAALVMRVLVHDLNSRHAFHIHSRYTSSSPIGLNRQRSTTDSHRNGAPPASIPMLLTPPIMTPVAIALHNPFQDCRPAVTAGRRDTRTGSASAISSTPPAYGTPHIAARVPIRQSSTTIQQLKDAATTIATICACGDLRPCLDCRCLDRNPEAEFEGRSDTKFP